MADVLNNNRSQCHSLWAVCIPGLKGSNTPVHSQVRTFRPQVTMHPLQSHCTRRATSTMPKSTWGLCFCFCFLFVLTATQLTLPGHQEHIRVGRSTKVVRRISTTPAIDIQWYAKTWTDHVRRYRGVFVYQQTFFLGLGCYAAIPLALRLQQERIKVVRSNRVARKRRAWGHSRHGPWTEVIRIHIKANKRGIEQNTHPLNATSGVWRAHIRNRNWFFILQLIAFGVSFDHNVQSQSRWSLYSGLWTWKKRPR